MAEKRGPDIVSGKGVDRELRRGHRDDGTQIILTGMQGALPQSLDALAASLTSVGREAPDPPAPRSQSLTQSF